MASDKPKPSQELESLMCSLCLDVFEEATLLRCGHTFCRKCLNRYDQCHPHNQQSELESSMVCPLCRQETNLSAEGVAGLPSNVSVNNLVEEFNDSSNPLRKLYDERHRCSQCVGKPEGQGGGSDVPDAYAVVFCCDCDVYLCEGCLTSHKKFEITVFNGHRVVHVRDVMRVGRSSDVSKFGKCPEHATEIRDFYCADCREVICHKCTIVNHNVRDHKITKRADVEEEIRGKLAALVDQCENEKDSLEAFIRKTEQERLNTKVSLQEVLQNIECTFADLQRQLEERKGKLKSEVESINASCDDQFDSLKVAAQKMSSQLSAAQCILERREGHSCLEGDALLSHEHLMTELEGLIGSSQSWIRESQDMPGNVTQRAAVSTFLAQPVEISKIGRITGRKWQLSKEVELPYNEPLNGLSVLSPESVLVGYYNHPPDQFSLDGSKTSRKVHSTTLDTTVLSDGRIAAIHNTYGYLNLFDVDYKATLTQFKTRETTSTTMVDSDSKDHIHVAYWDEKLIQVFSPNGGDPIREINVKSTPRQVHTTTCGRLVIQSLDGVRVLDEGGKEIAFIKNSDTESSSYPAVDENDTLYVAKIQIRKSILTIKSYTLDGVLVETILDDIKIKVSVRSWYYMKCPSPDTIVFCTAGMMYVFKNDFEYTK